MFCVVISGFPPWNNRNVVSILQAHKGKCGKEHVGACASVQNSLLSWTKMRNFAVGPLNKNQCSMYSEES